MSSVGTGRAVQQAWRAWEAVCKDPSATELQKHEAWVELRRAREIHDDYLQSERDDARAERDEQ
jgi:hypothetical protein